MKVKPPQIILASASPRRKYLLGMLLTNFGLKFKVKPSDIDETVFRAAKNFTGYVQQLALDKALSVASKHSGLIIGADTIVVLKNNIINKPNSKLDAKRILNSLSDNTHTVFTGLAIVNTFTKLIFVDYESTKVKFRKLLSNEIDRYVASGSPMDKAGAYGIQDDFGCTFVEKINGDYFNVVGLPVLKTYIGLKHFLNFYKDVSKI